MKKLAILSLGLLLVFWVGGALATDLLFPKTEEEIVRGLSLRDGRTVYNGIEYVAEQGKVYKIIKGRRFRVRGLSVIARSELAPRIGAIIHFDFNKATIKPETYPLLNEFGGALGRGLSNAVVQIEGHTDLVGSHKVNDRLSLERTETVKDYLVTFYGIEPYRLKVVGCGKRRPLLNSYKECELNRRVEFVRIR